MGVVVGDDEYELPTGRYVVATSASAVCLTRCHLEEVGIRILRQDFIEAHDLPVRFFVRCYRWQLAALLAMEWIELHNDTRPTKRCVY
jgi:hypothetical protein